MSDFNNKIKAKTIIAKVHTEYKEGDISFGERPDIHIKKSGNRNSYQKINYLREIIVLWKTQTTLSTGLRKVYTKRQR